MSVIKYVNIERVRIQTIKPAEGLKNIVSFANTVSGPEIETLCFI